MIIIIPLGGIGKRFSDLGYTDPKPLIKANGKEIIFWVIDNLKIKKNDKIYIVYNSILENYNFEKILITKNSNINFFKLPHPTNGPVETVSVFLKEILKDNLNEKVLLIDGDTFYKKDIIKILKNKKNNSILYFKTNNPKPIFSYIKINNKKITDIEEKKLISYNANSGAYFFSTVEILYNYIKKTLKKYSTHSYISHVYKEMIADKILIEPIYISSKDFVCLGTPEQVKDFSIDYNFPKKRFCFDLDNTLVSFPKIKNNYSTVSPIYKNIKFLKTLKDKGHYIIIYTARRMKTHNSNVKKVIKEIKLLTISQLKKFKIPYDELIFGKPYAHYYIDDLSVNSLDNLNFKLGYYDVSEKFRSFNKVTVGEKYTKKESTNIKKLNNEIMYYKSLPHKIKKYFPRLLEYQKNWYKIDTINGTSYEYLFLNNILQQEHLKSLINNLQDIHSCKKFFKNYNFIYKNYSIKTSMRIKEISRTDRFNNSLFFSRIIKELNNYEKSNEAEASIIHGDPVFSNIIKEEGDNIKFIDPRGGHLSSFSIYGDKFYDYAKVYQSLTGYHQIINDKNLQDVFVDKLVSEYKKIIINNFGKSSLKKIKLITASLYVGLIPFHDNKYSHKFIFLAKNIFKDYLKD